MRAMTDPMAGTRHYRARIARLAAAAADEWMTSDDVVGLSPMTVAQLRDCARWLLEMLEPAGPADGPDVLGKANRAIMHLDGRECRNVLSLLAMRRPGAVLAAIAESEH